MNKKILVIILIIILSIFWFVFKKPINGNKKSLLTPGVAKTEILPVPTPTPAIVPKTFKFDKTTDLKKELENINPEVLESDFQ